MDDIKNDIHKSRLRWFGPVIRMRDARIPKKILQENWRENDQ